MVIQFFINLLSTYFETTIQDKIVRTHIIYTMYLLMCMESGNIKLQIILFPGVMLF